MNKDIEELLNKAMTPEERRLRARGEMLFYLPMLFFIFMLYVFCIVTYR